MRIDTIESRSIPDTRGRPTVEVTLSAQQGSTLNQNPQGRTLLRATASVPSGKSTGSHEALELREADGGIAQALQNIQEIIAFALSQHDFESADAVDAFLIELDGTANKSRLGANAMLAVSIAAMRLFALAEKLPLWSAIAERAALTPGAPRLYVNMMNGGVHADFKLPFQEYILVVEGTTSVALPIAQAAFAKLGERLGASVPMGDEGGYAPTFDTLEQPFDILSELVKEFPGTSIAIDAAASELFHDGAYHLLGKSYTAEELTTIYRSISKRYPVRSIEDPFAEDAGDDFARLTAILNSPSTSLGATTILVVGDDLTVTNRARIVAAADARAINAVLIKPNQIGTIKEALAAVQETYDNGWKAIASHRSGETLDTFIADFAYGIGAYGIKAGGLGQKERLAKYERLLAIEREAQTM